METEAARYAALAGEPTGRKEACGFRRRFAIVVSGVLTCLLNAGLAFGFSGLLPVLLADGAFQDDCGQAAGRPCERQLLELTGMFTLATSTLNLMAMPSGAVLDRLGPRATAQGFALTVALGCAVFACGGTGPYGRLSYYLGFLLMAVGGPCIFNCTLSFGNLFPGHKGLITAALVGSFDASSIVFVALAAVYREGAPFADIFFGYACIPLMAAAAARLLWPREAVSSTAEAQAGEGEAEDGVGELPPKCSSLATLPLRKQLLSVEFCLVLHTVCVTMVCINFFIATAFSQLVHVEKIDARELTNIFALCLPAGGLVYIPVIGAVIDNAGLIWGFLVLWFSYVLFAALMFVYTVTHTPVVAYLAFAIFSFCRPLFYTLGASFCGQIFGFQNFGKVYGLVTTCAGAANLLVQPLEMLGEAKGFGLPNALLLAAMLSTAALPLFVSRRGKRTAQTQPRVTRKMSQDITDGILTYAGGAAERRQSSKLDGLSI